MALSTRQALQLRPVGAHRQRMALRLGDQGDAVLLGQAREAPARPVEGVAQIEGAGDAAHLADLERVEEQHRLDEVQEALRIGLDALERGLVLGAELGLQLLGEHVAEAHDRVQRRAQLVREVVEEVVAEVARAQRRAPPLDGALDQVGDLRNVEGLGDVVEDPMAQAADRGVERGVAGDDDDLDVGIEALDVLHHLGAGHAGHAHVEGDDVDRALAQDGEGFLSPGGGEHVVVRLEHHAQRLGRAALVVDYQEGCALIDHGEMPCSGWMGVGKAPCVPEARSGSRGLAAAPRRGPGAPLRSSESLRNRARREGRSGLPRAPPRRCRGVLHVQM